MHVWRHRGGRTLAACIRHHPTGPSPAVKVWGTTGCTSRSSLVRTDGTLNSARYISDLSPIGNVWFMVAEQLARHYKRITTVEELWHRIVAAFASAPLHAIQSLFDSMPRRIGDVIFARGGCSGY
ncbi:odorant receptor [Trichonephila clavipes]|nr:odorant receptor [Trichonephila clavipes]